MVPLDCFVATIGVEEEEEEDPRVVSFSSKEISEMNQRGGVESGGVTFGEFPRHYS